MATSGSAVTPRGNLHGFASYFSHDILSGFLVFLIALPLCLGISLASGFPAIAGVFTAIVGAVLTTFISNSELTIKGPAAGLIVIAVGAITDFKVLAADAPDPALAAYRMALAVGVAAGVIQILFGMFRAGILGEFFPTSVVHGMLSAIGVIIIAKQVPILFGVLGADGKPLELLKEIPQFIAQMNPEIATIGVLSLLLLFGLPLIKHPLARKIPAQMIVILVAVPLGMYFQLSQEHTYSFFGNRYELGEQFLVNVPGNLLNAVAHPDFSALQHPIAWKWVLMFALIGSLESLLSVKAVDLIDPWKRKTNLNRDLLAIGVANTVAASVGGLPMISEIVRSKANIDSGARTRFADFWHGIFLLAFVALIPGLIHQIPLAALAAMLVYTGFRLASPKEFVHVYHIGREQFLVFTATMIGVLAIDLLVGVFIGIGVKLAFHLINGVPVRSLFKSYLEVEEQGSDTYVIRARESAVFSNWIPFKRTIEDIGLVQRKNLIIDLADAKLVDHSVMEKLANLQREFQQEGLSLELVGLDSHQPLAAHEHSARKRTENMFLKRITVMVDQQIAEDLERAFVALGASGFTSVACRGLGRQGVETGSEPKDHLRRIEVVVPTSTSEAILEHLRTHVIAEHPITVTVEIVEVLRLDHFTQDDASLSQNPNSNPAPEYSR